VQQQVERGRNRGLGGEGRGGGSTRPREGVGLKIRRRSLAGGVVGDENWKARRRGASCSKSVRRGIGGHVYVGVLLGKFKNDNFLK